MFVENCSFLNENKEEEEEEDKPPWNKTKCGDCDREREAGDDCARLSVRPTVRLSEPGQPTVPPGRQTARETGQSS